MKKHKNLQIVWKNVKLIVHFFFLEYGMPLFNKLSVICHEVTYVNHLGLKHSCQISSRDCDDSSHEKNR